MTFIEIPRGRYYIRPRKFPSYVRWRVEGSAGHRIHEFLRSVSGASITGPLPPEVRRGREAAEELGLEPGWIRHPRVATRILLFDDDEQKVGRVPRDTELVASIDTEIEARRKVGPLAPRILETGAGSIAEEWIEARASRSDPRSDAESWLRPLVDRLYEPRWERVEAHVERLVDDRPRVPDHLQLARVLVRRAGDVEIPLTEVHGDFTAKNLLVRGDGTPVLTDWEFVGSRLESYDAWYHRYTAERQRGSGAAQRLQGAAKAVAEFRTKYGHELPGLTPEEAHALHLLERVSILDNLGPSGLSDRKLGEDISTVMTREQEAVG